VLGEAESCFMGDVATEAGAISDLSGDDGKEGGSDEAPEAVLAASSF
jgi:hypothetical protein